MKCKFCGSEKIRDDFGHLYCDSENHQYAKFVNGEETLILRNNEVDNLIKMRAEHAGQKERIAELEKQLADLTPPIKIGDFFWGVYDNVVFEYTCDHCYKVDDKWIVVWLDSNFDEHKLVWGETAFATEVEAERLNGVQKQSIGGAEI